MFKSALVILSGNAVSALLMLARNLLIARLISVENYGIAATFGLALAIIEMTSTFGLQQQLVQDKRGNDPDFQAALQGFQVLRGLINAAILFALAGPFTSFLGVPEVKWAHQVIALVLVMNGMVHFDIHRLSRQMRYVPAALAAILSPVAALVAIWPLEQVFGDYQVMLWSLVIQSAATALVSHLVAERPYRMRLDRAVMAQSLRFGWPLLIDGLMLFAIFNGEKLIVGREFGMGPLALFTMAVTLTLTPALVLQKSAASFFLPQLSATGPEKFDGIATISLQCHLLFGAVLVASVVVFGEAFVHLVLGAKYQGVIVLLNLLAVMQAFKVMKSGTATVAMARAHTSNGMVSNVLRVGLLPVAWYVAVQGAGVLQVIWIGILGEALGVAASLYLLRRQSGVSLRGLWPAILLVGLQLAITAAGANLDLPWYWQASVVALMLVAPLAMPDLRRYVMNRVVTHHQD